VQHGTEQVRRDLSGRPRQEVGEVGQSSVYQTIAPTTMMAATATMSGSC